MFLQNLLSKIKDAVSKVKPDAAPVRVAFNGEIFHFIKKNRRQLLIAGACIILILCIILLWINLAIKNKTTYPSLRERVTVKTGMEMPVDGDKSIFIKDLPLYPELPNSDLTNDYVDFIPLNSYNRPDIAIVDREFDKLIDLTAKDSLQFTFEKKQGK